MGDMGDRLRLAFGIMANAASLLLYAAPTLTFSRVIKKKSTAEYSCIPYITTLLSCLIYTWYGLPVVSYRWENFPVVTVNGLGILLEISFVLVFFIFAPARGKMKVAAIVIPVILLFSITAVISALVFHDHHHRKVFVGSVGFVACISMYASPLVVVKQVIKTKSVEFMPFYLSFFSFLSGSLWTAYGLLSHDFFITSPSLVGSILSLLQLIVYCKYRKRGVIEEPNKMDLEQNEEKPKQLQLVINNDTNGKI